MAVAVVAAGKTKTNCSYKSTQVSCSICTCILEIEAELGLEVFNRLQVLSYSGDTEDGTTRAKPTSGGAEGKQMWQTRLSSARTRKENGGGLLEEKEE